MPSVSRYIKLTVKGELKPDEVKLWFNTVRDSAPNGILYSVQVVNRAGNPKVASLIKRKRDDSTDYLIPLTRDLTELETEKIVQAWDAVYPEKDMAIEISSASNYKLDQQAPSVRVPNSRYLGLCVQLAKSQHENWMRERADAGWRWGPRLSLKDKTHPLLRPWDQLPGKYQRIDQDTPQKVLQLLNDFGYAVISRGELDALTNLMRGIA